MKDILDRELHDGDMAIGMAIGRYSHGMHIGVIQSSSVCRAVKSYGSDDYYLKKSATSNTYLIANPTDEELEIKNRVISLLEKERIEKEAKNKIKTIPLKSLIVGGIYEDVSNNSWIYLGNREVIITDDRNCELYHASGNTFCNAMYDDEKNADAYLERINVQGWGCVSGNLSVIKGNKKLTKLLKNINEEIDFNSLFPMESKLDKQTGYYSWDKRKQVIK